MNTTKLITTLSKAHQELVNTDLDTPMIGATARKIESTLLSLVKDIDKDAFTRTINVALINSGSLKAIKLAPKTTKPIVDQYAQACIDSHFVMTQSQAYLREAFQRGFKIEPHERYDMIRDKAKTGESPFHDDILIGDNNTPHHCERLLALVLKLKAENAQHIAGLVTKILKTTLKEKPEAFLTQLERLCVVHRIDWAGPIVFKAMVAHALLGTKKPVQDRVENFEVMKLINTIFSTAGRKALREETGGFEAWIAKGAPAPKAIQTLEEQRQTGARDIHRRRW